MKRKILASLFLSILCVICAVGFVACESTKPPVLDENNCIVFNTLTVKEKTASGTVDQDTEVFSFLDEIKVKGKATYSVSLDIGGFDVVPNKIVTLNTGYNTFYVREECGNDTKIYTVRILRKTLGLDEYNRIEFKTFTVRADPDKHENWFEASNPVDPTTTTFDFANEIIVHGQATYSIYETGDDMLNDVSIEGTEVSITTAEEAERYWIKECCGADFHYYSVLVKTGLKAGGADTLQMWINQAGYGTDWLDGAFELFAEQDWVKEKYDGKELSYSVSTMGGGLHGPDRIVNGGTQYDLVLTTVGLNSATYLENYRYFEDLTDLYERTIPGEEQTLSEKMGSRAKDTLLTIKQLEDPIRLGVPWATSPWGWYYNETSLREYIPSYSYANLPRTTNEFIDLLDDIKLAISNSDKAGKDWAVFNDSAAVSYWTSLATTYWSQYDGVQAYNNYFECKNDKGLVDFEAAAKNSESVGRLYALRALEEVINYDNGYICDADWRNTYSDKTNSFASGDQFVFYWNGGWIENETKDHAKEGEVLRLMKTPVNSAIIGKLSFANEDYEKAERLLSKMIKCIDEGYDFDNTRVQLIKEGVFTEEDYNIVKSARNIVSPINGHQAYIPVYCDAKQLAEDFLLFLASDVGIEYTAKQGIISPYLYDYFRKEEVSNNLSQLQKDIINIMNDARENNSILRDSTSFPTVYYGGLKAWHTHQHPHIGAVFVAPYASSRKTPTELFNLCKVSQATFLGILSASGI